MADHYDLVVIGGGPGGAALAHRLTAMDTRILLIERCDHLPRSHTNWDAKAVFVDMIYQARETWYGASGKAFHSGIHRLLGGNSKVHGAALFRLRERDFDEKRHKDGIPPAWPLKRIYYNSDAVMLDVGKVNLEAAKRLKRKLERLLAVVGAHPVPLNRRLTSARTSLSAARRTRPIRHGSAWNP